MTDENNCSSNGTPSYWRTPNYLSIRFFEKLKEILELRSENETELHVREVDKRDTRIEIENSE